MYLTIPMPPSADISVTIRRLKLSSDGVFWVKDSDKIIAHQPTAIKTYDKDDDEHVSRGITSRSKPKNRSG